MLNRVQINDYRCLREVDVPLKPLTVLIGPNNTGKSAFLSAIELLGKTPEKPDGNFLAKNTDLWNLDLSTEASLVGTTEAGNEVRVERGPINEPERDFWVRKGNNSEIVPIAFFDNAALIPEMTSEGVVEGQGVPQLDDKASNVPAYLDVLLRRDRDRFFRITSTLRDLIPGFVDLNIETPSVQQRRIDLVLENNITMDASLASYGVRLLIFFVSLANHPNPPNTILLEEPETGLHPARLKDVVELLEGLSEGKFADHQAQVILSTHSPYLLDCIDVEKHQVLVFERKSNGSRVARPVDTDRLKVFLDEFMLGEIWVNQEEHGLVKKDR